MAHYLKTHGADIRLIAEQAPWSKLIRFGAALPSRKWLEALRLWNPCFSPSTWVTEAQGTTHVKSVSAGGKKIPCDYLAIGYGLVPNTELPQLMKVDPCALDEYQRTSNPAIFCAGEVTGIGGVDLSIVEGSIAGYAAAGDVEKARAFFVQRDRWKRFGTALAEAFALRPELAQLARPDTFVCRCEDVTYQAVSYTHLDGQVAIENVPSYRAAKDVAVESVIGDIAWGGNWFFLIPVSYTHLAHAPAGSDRSHPVWIGDRAAVVCAGDIRGAQLEPPGDPGAVGDLRRASDGILAAREEDSVSPLAA